MRARRAQTGGTGQARAREKVRQRPRYEAAVADCSKSLLTNASPGEALPPVLARLRESTGVSGVRLFENFTGAAGEPCARAVFESRETDEEDRSGGSAPEILRYDALPRWRDAFAAGDAIRGPVASFPASERALLEPRGARSLLALPVFGGGEWRGFMVFEDVAVIRPWGTRDVRLLQAIAEMIGGYLHRHRSDERSAALLADLNDERDALDTISRTGRLLSAELNLDNLVQAATDAATELTGAQFGAFFYNVLDAQGEAYLLYTISGAPREAFSRFPYPRATPLFGPTFRGEGIIRSDDITADPRYGTLPPHHGMPAGHLPVRSYLAVPVLSRSGEVLGGLFFGHEAPGVFTERAERNLVALVAQIAIAVDNARLYGEALRANEHAQQEIEERRRVEAELRVSEARHREVLKEVLASVTGDRLRLVTTAAELPPRLPAFRDPVELSRTTLSLLRRHARAAAEAAGLNSDRLNDLVTAASEAGMNAVVHADGGTATVAADTAKGVVQVWITDRGHGIEMSRLPRATLDVGYTTKGTLGHGFKMVLKTIDVLWLLTSPTGTTLVLEQNRVAPKPRWLDDVPV